ncbi:MAG: FAD-dependent oxidoreductase [Gammaproteobacteria bacterium]|nr:MAG: FAD-dependent oxidoreductase [Gammaproteobacteria bacterium]
MSPELDLIVVGGGAAGVTATRRARALGLKTLLLDEQATPGGNAYRNIDHNSGSEPRLTAALGAAYLAGRDVIGECSGTNADNWSNVQVWHLDQSGMVGILRDGRAEFLQARRVLVATGAMERPVPIPGWTLPGVMTVGACQTLLKSSALVPTAPTLMAGRGPLLLLTACQLLALGVPVRAVVMSTPWWQYLAAGLRELPAAVRMSRSLAEGLGWLARLRRGGIPVYDGAESLSVIGSDQATGLEFRTGRRLHRLDGNLILLHEGIVPDTSLTMASDCDQEWDEQQLCWRPKTDPWGRTSAATIFVAGDGARILGAAAAPLSAALAALAIACDLGRISTQERDRRARPLRTELARHQRFRRFLDALYPPPRTIRGGIADSTIICRCEGVTAGDLRQVIRLGCLGPNQAKSFTRCGMGPCQGRMCGLAVTEIFASECNREPQAVGYFRIRPPVKPLTLEQFAGAAPMSDAPLSRDMVMLAANGNSSRLMTSE